MAQWDGIQLCLNSKISLSPACHFPSAFQKAFPKGPIFPILYVHCAVATPSVFPDAVGNDFCSRLWGANVGTFWPAVGSRKRVVFEDLQSFSSHFWF